MPSAADERSHHWPDNTLRTSGSRKPDTWRRAATRTTAMERTPPPRQRSSAVHASLVTTDARISLLPPPIVAGAA